MRKLAAEHVAWNEQLDGEPVRASLVLRHASATWPNASAIVVEQKMREAVRDRDALLGNGERPTVNDHRRTTRGRDEFVHVRGQHAAGNEQRRERGLDDLARRERRPRQSCFTTKFRSNLDRGR